MNCPTCAMSSPTGSIQCTYCGARLVPSAESYPPPHPAYVPPHPAYPPPHPAYPPPRFAPAPVAGLAKALTVLLFNSAVCQTALAAFSLAGGSVGPMTALNLLLFVAIATVFLIWLYRVRKNAGMWGPHRRAQGWAIGAWFTPWVNLWFPVQIIRDVARASSTQLPEHSEQTAVARLVAGWWTCWVLSWVTGYRVSHTSSVRSFGQDGSIVVVDQAGFFMDGTFVSALCLALGALLMQRMIVKITAMQRARGVA